MKDLYQVFTKTCVWHGKINTSIFIHSFSLSKAAHLIYVCLLTNYWECEWGLQWLSKDRLARIYKTHIQTLFRFVTFLCYYFTRFTKNLQEATVLFGLPRKFPSPAKHVFHNYFAWTLSLIAQHVTKVWKPHLNRQTVSAVPASTELDQYESLPTLTLNMNMDYVFISTNNIWSYKYKPHFFHLFIFL